MKGFPNQIADFKKLSIILSVILQLLEKGENPRNDETLGLALVREGVLSTGHTPVPVETYINKQLTKKPSNRSFQTTARGSRELFRILGLLTQTSTSVSLTNDGVKIASFAGKPLTQERLNVWRNLVTSMSHKGKDETASHPYQVLLRLISRKPGITRADMERPLSSHNI